MFLSTTFSTDFPQRIYSAPKVTDMRGTVFTKWLSEATLGNPDASTARQTLALYAWHHPRTAVTTVHCYNGTLPRHLGSPRRSLLMPTLHSSSMAGEIDVARHQRRSSCRRAAGRYSAVSGTRSRVMTHRCSRWIVCTSIDRCHRRHSKHHAVKMWFYRKQSATAFCNVPLFNELAPDRTTICNATQ